MKVGDKWKSKLTDMTFTVDAVSKESIEVSVERSIKGNIEVRKRTLTPAEFVSFSSGYDRQKK